MQRLLKCNTPSTDCRDMKLFLKQNPHLLFVEIDKSKNLALVDSSAYIQKLIQVFGTDKFIKLSRNPVEQDIINFQNMIKTITPFLSTSNSKRIRPYHSIKKGHGILKVHKIGNPLRPIINSKFSITSGAEIYLLEILKPLVKQCSFSLTSTMAFTHKFKEIAPKYTKFYEVVTVDAVNLFTSINVPRVVEFIVEKIYSNPTAYFSPNSNENVTFPPRHIFHAFMLNVLLKYSSFSTLSGFYRQSEGLSMGSKISPAISTIFFKYDGILSYK